MTSVRELKNPRSWKDVEIGLKVRVVFPHRLAAVDPSYRNSTEYREGVVIGRDKWGTSVRLESGGHVICSKLGEIWV